jgi:uroporphyrinogen-III synthase
MVAADPDLRGAAVLLPRAEDGRDELAQLLTAAGADVQIVTTYRTVPASAAELEPLLARLRAAELDVLTFFSPSQVEAVAAHASAEILNRAKLIAAIGATTAEALRARGIRVDLIPAAPSAEALASELVQRYIR